MTLKTLKKGLCSSTGIIVLTLFFFPHKQTRQRKDEPVLKYPSIAKSSLFATSGCLLEQGKWCPAHPLSEYCSPKRIWSLLDPAEAAWMGVAGLACVKRVLINSQAYKWIEVSKTSHIFQMSLHTRTILKSRARPTSAIIAAFYQRQGRRWHKELGFFVVVVVSVLDFFQADFSA